MEKKTGEGVNRKAWKKRIIRLERTSEFSSPANCSKLVHWGQVAQTL